MGRKYIYFKCHHCGHCCTDVICCPTPYDVIQIVKATKLHPRKFLEFVTEEEITGVYKSDPTWLKINGKKYMMTLKRNSKGCYFRDPVKKYVKFMSTGHIYADYFRLNSDKQEKEKFTLFLFIRMWVVQSIGMEWLRYLSWLSSGR